MLDVRCTNCNKLLCKIDNLVIERGCIEIKCRCHQMNRILGVQESSALTNEKHNR